MLLRLLAALALVLVAALPADAQKAGPRVGPRAADPLPPPGWTITARTDLVAPDGSAIMTVPIWRPTTPDHALAIDCSPNGEPAEIGGSGFCWIDLCDRDLVAHIAGTLPQTVIYCTYAGITSAGARFGIRRFGTGPLKPVQIVTSNIVLGTFKRQNGDTGPPQLIVGDFDSIAAAAAVAQMASLRRELDRMSQRLAAAEAKVRNLERPGISR